uniref:CC2D2A N-terminal C2 domain-containing protein n=1 Tax=Panagrolaimus davidi TaxID=227884 RepID=A0A914PPB6_9BILA
MGLIEYTKAVNWAEWDTNIRPTLEFFEFSLDLNRIEFEHHWAFTIEDKLARKIKTYHHELTTAGTKAMKIMEQYLMEKVTVEVRILSEEQQTEAYDRLKYLEEEFSKILIFYQNLSARIKQAWRELNEERKKLKTPNTTLILKEAKLPETFEIEYLPEKIREFTQLPVFVLENVENKELPNTKKTLSKIRIQVLIFFNDTLVCRTPSTKMNTDFSVDFRKVYQLRIYEPPEKVMLLIRELQPGSRWIELSRVYIPFPDDQKELEEIDFGSDIVVEKTSKTLGCGHPDRKSQCLQGKIFCKLRWTQPSFEKVFKKSLLRNSISEKEEAEQPFELIPKEVRLVSDEEFSSDIRLEALAKRYRNSNNQTFRDDQKWIGLNSAEIDGHWALEDLREDEIGLDAADFSMDAMRKAGIKYAALIRKNLIESFSRDKRLKSYEDIVKEDILPTGFSGFGTLFGTADLSRKLKPMRTLNGRTQTHSKKLKLVLNIQSAANLPERIDKKSMEVLIEATFQSSIARTGTVSGKNANWQQTLILDLDDAIDVHHDLKSITDNLELNLYDKQINKLPHDSREPNTIHEQFEHRWLGRVIIPFSTILSLTKIDGVITIKEPLFFTGYKLHKHKAYLKVMITMDPPVPASLFSAYENFLPGETPTLMAECRRFEARNRQVYSNRRYLALVNDSNGKRILACRYLRPIKPPYQIQEILTNSNNLIEAINLTAHIVSCIPFIADPIMFPGVVDLWTTTEQLLTIGCGDEEEHAVLLVCWLLHLHLSAALILGQALPEGPKAAYVLVQVENNVSLLVNPSDGNVYSISDPLCPLISIGTIVTMENIYANIQKVSNPCLMDFDLKNKSNWDPLFSTSRHDLSSIQPTELTYIAVNEDIIVELRSNLEREIKLKFDEARKHAIPQWNLMASRALREILSEGSTGSGYDFDIEHRLGQTLNSYHVTVVAFRSPYISRQKLIEEVLKTNMHINSNKNAQFALSIHIQPFVNNLISCSVAIASLLPKHL